MEKKIRYPFFKVAFVVIILNVIALSLSLLIIKYANVPNQTLDIKDLCSPHALIKTSVSVLFNILFFYFGLNKWHNLLVSRKKWQVHILFALLLLAISVVYNYLYSFSLSAKQTAQLNEIGSGLKLFSYFFSGVLMVTLCFFIVYINNLRFEKKEKNILEQQAIQLETKNTQANYNFLKAQINPHFLHNTLNFLYAKSLPYSQELSDGILTLSEIMRYSLNNGEDAAGKVLLSSEIEHVRNVIKINQLRFSNKLQVNFEVTGVVGALRIIPFVLITIVENAFKHGDLKNPDYPVMITLSITDTSITFYCSNKKKTGPKELSTGIGLSNIKKRLELAYGRNYLFTVKDEADFYTTELTISLL